MLAVPRGEVRAECVFQLRARACQRVGDFARTEPAPVEEVASQHLTNLGTIEQRVPALSRGEEVGLEMELRGYARGARRCHLLADADNEAVHAYVDVEEPAQKRRAPGILVRRHETAIDLLYANPRIVEARLDQSAHGLELGTQFALQNDQAREQAVRDGHLRPAGAGRRFQRGGDEQHPHAAKRAATQ